MNFVNDSGGNMNVDRSRSSRQNDAKWLRNAWYQIAWSSDIERGATLARTLLGEPLVIYRGVSGHLSVLFDRCAHRFAPLSRGVVMGDAIRCPYHGLAFGRDGRCVANPHGPVASAMKVRSYPVEERHTAVWVWMGDEECDPGRIPDLSFIDQTPETARITGYLPTAANYQLLSDNILDLSHADYLHPTSLGGMMTGVKTSITEREGGISVEWLAHSCDAPPALKPQLGGLDCKADIWIQVSWQAPAAMVLAVTVRPAGVPRQPEDEGIALHNMSPETPSTSHYFFCATRRFLVDDVEFGESLRKALMHAFSNEDKPILEAQQIRMGTDDIWRLEPVLLSIDGPAVRVRRRLQKLIDAEAASRSNPGSPDEESARQTI
jgi:phenylpropionate dioxygenase-like ring-hydroxylating dioxygenase large terminal subunit